ncbi:HlyD family efflux transporter periplasmic adaptor subunit [Anaerocolumna sedimenticola]|uniref:HlyD family efflux transporter periplasmic adaptor subunit n=1 Tax=Anaerocolumna sedimenticola TaxID=2696063 RepID=A0A6P1TPL9_9FIRM|nr:efflux RND transporter periplasmic adaptor subunit [Anaerocolumna sedimenticola]QHQ62403.1 HlyD family efflux transporter periplasmic adaptor subunit [Anaerocolumna sedimenticola]
MGIKLKLFKKSDKLSSTEQLIIPKKSKKKKIFKIAAVLIVLILIVSVVYNRSLNKKAAMTGAGFGTQTAKVEKRDIKSILSSSGTIEPLNTYDVKTLVEGEVISADFEEGDQVKEDDVLYQVTTDDIDSKIDTSKNSVERSKEDYKIAKDNYNKAVDKYNDALADYNDAEEEYSDLAIKSKKTGVVKKVYVEEGDTIQIGTQIADIYDNSSMLLEVPFNSADVSSSLIGKTAEIELVDSNETLEGKVTKVSNLEDVLSGNRVVKMVTIEVKNPGGLMTSTNATASIGDLYSSGEGTFSVLEESTITADKAGKIHTLNIEEGDKISSGNTVVILDSDTYEDQLDSYQNALDSAKDAVDNAKNSMDDAQEKIEDAEDSLDDVIDDKTDYSITAPISGQVVSKDVLAGDTISRESTTKLCTIYDLSAVTFDMQIDELDIMKVKVGQKVNITADALEGKTFTGEVTNISLESTTKEGVTQYPVTVRIDEVGDLLPGMNVDGEIVLDEVSGVLAIPNDALMRGDVVYVKDASVKEAVGDVPAGFKEVQVKAGISDDNYTEITSGLTGNEEVYVKRNATGVQMMGQYGPGGGPDGQGGGQGEVRQAHQAEADSRP